MLDELPPEEWSLRELSRRVGLAKSNVVRYFPTREAVFLQLLVEELDEWLEAVEERLPRPDRRRSTRTRGRQVAVVIASTLGERPRLCHLLASCAAVLERNVPLEVARDFKTDALSRLERLGALVHTLLPEIPREGATRVMGTLWVLVAGAWPMANPAPELAALRDEPALAALRVDFAGDVADTLAYLLTGIAAYPPGTVRG